MFLVIKVGQKILPINFYVVKMVQLKKNITLDFGPYLSNAVQLRHGSCTKMISSIRQLQPCPQWCYNDDNHTCRNPDA